MGTMVHMNSGLPHTEQGHMRDFSALTLKPQKSWIKTKTALLSGNGCGALLYKQEGPAPEPCTLTLSKTICKPLL
jgi:hypothetical protein